MIAGLSFGFWSGLFTGRYENLWTSHLRLAFPNGTGRRKQVNGLVQTLRKLRNRIAHHEAVFASDLAGKHDKLLELAGLIDEDARAYVEGRSRMPDILSRRPR